MKASETKGNGEKRRNKKKKKAEEETKRKGTNVVRPQVGSGSCLSSHAVASTVLSVYKGLTSVFGMRTGGTP